MNETQHNADQMCFEAMSAAGAYAALAKSQVRKANAEAELAENIAKEQHFKASIQALKWKQERIALDAQKDALQRSKQLKRPCMTLGVHVVSEDRGDHVVYVVRWSHLEAEGETPEMACSNFDRMWVGGDDL